VPDQLSDQLLVTARELSRVLEPFVGCVYFAPETHQGYVRLGFGGPSREAAGVQMPDGIAYFTSRGSLLGQVHGNLVASAFAVFNPAAVVPSVAAGWALTNAATIRQARQDGTLTYLHRALGPDLAAAPHEATTVANTLRAAVDACHLEGRPLFAGVMGGADSMPTDDMEAAWFLGDALRECRGDSHTAAWIAEGFDAVDIGLLSELYWGLPHKSYVRTRAWSEEQLDAGIERLTSLGLVANGGLTEQGRTVRESIEIRTDTQMLPAARALGDNAADVITTLGRWSATVRATFGYPASGPQDLVAATQRSVP
jgi:hypothetical protein